MLFNDEEFEEATCVFCGRNEPLEDAMDAGWTPSFYNRDNVECGPACDECAPVKLRQSEDGEWEEIKAAEGSI
jgi:hypothetical protein